MWQVPEESSVTVRFRPKAEAVNNRARLAPWTKFGLTSTEAMTEIDPSVPFGTWGQVELETDSLTSAAFPDLI